MSDKVTRPKAAVIGISESKLDSTVLDSEICIENYEILHGGGVASSISSGISYKSNWNSTLNILMPPTKPITVGILYRPSNQTTFFDIFWRKST